MDKIKVFSRQVITHVGAITNIIQTTTTSYNNYQNAGAWMPHPRLCWSS